MTAPALVCASLEIALNRYLRLEPAVVGECTALSGRGIAFEVADLGWTFTVEFQAGGVRVAGDAKAAEVRVTAPSLKLLRLALEGSRGAKLIPRGLEVQGDTELLTRFREMLARVGFDPEELAAKLVGDGAAHRLVDGAKRLFGWGRTAAQRLSFDTAEYLTEETGDLARGADVAEWMDAVDHLREATDRLEARLGRIETGAAAAFSGSDAEARR